MDFGLRALGFGFHVLVYGFGLRALGFGFHVSGSGFQVSGSRLRIPGCGFGKDLATGQAGLRVLVEHAGHDNLEIGVGVPPERALSLAGGGLERILTDCNR